MPGAIRLIIGLAGEPSLEKVAAGVARYLGMDLAERDSMYWGGTYYRARSDDEEITVYRNYDVLDDAPVFGNHADVGVLVMFDHSQRSPEEIADALAAQLGMAARVLAAA